MKKLKHIKLFESYSYETFDNNGRIICYHRSNGFEHMENNQLSIDNADDMTLFGKALYFASSSDISQQLGKYIGKYSIKLEEPCLDLNKEIDIEEINDIVVRFNKLSNKNFTSQYLNEEYEDVQIGDILVEISDEYGWEYNKYFKDLIQSYGYKSFKYFTTYHTDFRNDLGEYGYCYGIYNDSDAKCIEVY